MSCHHVTHFLHPNVSKITTPKVSVLVSKLSNCTVLSFLCCNGLLLLLLLF